MNHSWHVTLHSSPTGLTTYNLPYKYKNFQIDLDLIDHKLKVITSLGELQQFDLPGLSVAELYKKLFQILRDLHIPVQIYSKPVELADPIRFEEDTLHKTYDVEQATALHRSLLAMQEVFTEFRCNFKGKSSDIHFFWRSFDLFRDFQVAGLLNIQVVFPTWPIGWQRKRIPMKL